MTPDTELALRDAAADAAFCEAQIELDYRERVSRSRGRTPIPPRRWQQLDEIFGGDLQTIADTCRANPDEWYQFVFERGQIARRVREARLARAQHEAWLAERENTTLDERLAMGQYRRRAAWSERTGIPLGPGAHNMP